MRIICTVVMLVASEVVLGAPLSEDTKDDAVIPQLPLGPVYTDSTNQQFLLIYTQVGGSLFQGDIAGVKLVPLSEVDSVEARNAIKDPNRFWPAGQIPYVISEGFGVEQRHTILGAMDEFSSKSCVTWIPRNAEDHPDFVEFVVGSDGECWSYVGKESGGQVINLVDWCFDAYGTLIHEMLHSVGFDHEQSRPDRDEFVEIKWKNIQPDAESQFVKLSSDNYTTLSLPYDYNSVMHYPRGAFSKNGEDTIIPKWEVSENTTLGQREGFSSLDLLKLNALYNCSSKNEVPIGSNCLDVYPECIEWSQIANGCNRFREFMAQYCPKTCGVKRCRGEPELRREDNDQKP